MKLGFLMSGLGNFPLPITFVDSANAFLAGRVDTDIIAFVSNQVRPVRHPTFSTMNINEAFDFNGVAIATDLHTAEKLARFPGPRKRYFYLWELEWVGGKTGRYFEELAKIYADPKLELVASKPDDKIIVEKCWNRTIKHIIPDCNVEAFAEMARMDVKN